MINKIRRTSKHLYSICMVLGYYKGLYVWLLQRFSTIIKKQKIIEKKHNIIRHFIDEKFSNVIAKSKQCDLVIPQNLSSDKTNIWFFWYQGMDSMPDIVRCCYEQLCRTYSSNEYIIHLLTKENINSYIQFPSYITNKLNDGEITLTHFSDILRFSLLYNFAGIWIDSTIWCQGCINRDLLKQPYWSIKLPRPLFTVSVSFYRWSIFILSFNRKNDPLAKTVLNLLLEYWKDEHFLVDYLLIDYFLEYAITKLGVGKEFFQIKESNSHLYDLAANLPQTFSLPIWNKMKNDTNFFKLTYKGKLVSMAQNNKESYYYKIIKK